MAGLLRDRYYEYAPDRLLDLLTGEALDSVSDARRSQGTTEAARSLILGALARLPRTRGCPCGTALENSILTRREAIPEARYSISRGKSSAFITPSVQG